jgi:carbonic anhydrase
MTEEHGRRGAAQTAPHISKRTLMQATGLGALLALLGPPRRGRGDVHAQTPVVPSVTSGDEALQKLMAGNQRHLSGTFTLTTRLAERRQAVATVQRPFAAILGCSDSRLPPEIIFDHTLGDLFVVRVAGNILHDPGMGSLEFAVTNLGTPLVMVLGHIRCGAVAAALAGSEAPGHIRSLIEAIQPAVAMTQGQPGDPLDNAIRANIRRSVGVLQGSQPLLAPLVAAGKLKIVGALYNLDSGAVELVV